MTVLEPWPSITRLTMDIWDRQCSSASWACPLLISSTRRSCDRIPRRRVAIEPHVVLTPAHGRHGPHHDLVEHLGQNAEGLIAGKRHEALVEAGVGMAERIGILQCRPLLVDQEQKFVGRRSSPAG